MDFGKKSDAKKAMKLMWKEGITLKQAWKKVQSKRSTKRKSTKRKSSGKKRAQDMAKKAMKLKWKEGITLKQAWKRVNKFGDTVCPPGFEPNVMWTGKSGQRQCIKTCGFYEMRDPVTNRCKKMNIVKPLKTVPAGMEINPSTGRLRKICVPPNVRNSRGRCVGSKLNAVPPPGMEINPATGRLRKMCLPGQYRDPVTLRCKTVKTELQPLVPVIPGGLMDFGKFRFGNRKCSFGSCSACNIR
tara:strand:- start:2560 stop:3288 length:729 start_codon:yes stop_codon:yes gene_type:complete